MAEYVVKDSELQFEIFGLSEVFAAEYADYTTKNTADNVIIIYSANGRNFVFDADIAKCALEEGNFDQTMFTEYLKTTNSQNYVIAKYNGAEYTELRDKILCYAECAVVNTDIEIRGLYAMKGVRLGVGEIVHRVFDEIASRLSNGRIQNLTIAVKAPSEQNGICRRYVIISKLPVQRSETLFHVYDHVYKWGYTTSLPVSNEIFANVTQKCIQTCINPHVTFTKDKKTNLIENEPRMQIYVVGKKEFATTKSYVYANDILVCVYGVTVIGDKGAINYFAYNYYMTRLFEKTIAAVCGFIKGDQRVLGVLFPLYSKYNEHFKRCGATCDDKYWDIV
jgi:hypothetical protein